MRLRRVQDEDWPAILALANAAVAHVPRAGCQQEWLVNRQAAGRTWRTQVQYVCEEGGAVAGYGAVESDERGEYRMFIVVDPTRLERVGARLYGYALTALRARNVGHVWFTEYAQDQPLLRFARDRGFQEVRRLPLEGGMEAIVMRKQLHEPAPSPSHH
jgi:N-acetylglutamate synthase-like GNAT family acetyltransferase